jgi:hypothetical protein
MRQALCQHRDFYPERGNKIASAKRQSSRREAEQTSIAAEAIPFPDKERAPTALAKENPGRFFACRGALTNRKQEVWCA